MTKFKKVLLASTAAVMTVALAIGGTIAYLTSEDSDVNVMTLGNVQIEQIEQQRVNDKDKQTELEKFVNAKPLYPAVFEGSSINWAPESEWVKAGEQAWKVVEDNANVVDKFVTVKNTGKSDAYVRTLIAYEGDETYGPNGAYIHIVTNGTNVAPQISNNFVGYINVDGVDYTVFEYIYPEALAKGETTIPSLKQVYMNKAADNDVVAYYGENYDILVLSQAVQTAGFSNAATALETAFPKGDNNKNVVEWFGGLAVPAVVNDEEGLLKALADGKDVLMTKKIEMEADKTAPYGNKYAIKQDGQTIDGGKNELYMECYGDDYGIMTSGGTIKNLTIQEGCRAVMLMYADQDVILDNVNIGGDGVLYPINTGEAGDASKVNLIVTNSTLAGWTSYGNINSASFTNVKFEQGTYYNNIYGRVLKPYVNTTLTDCEFVEHMNLDLSSLAQGHKITFVNCTVNGQKVTASTLEVPTTDADYDTMLFSVDLPSWASSIADCVSFK